MSSRRLPMLAKSAPAPFSGSDWLFEIKWDGVRAIAAVDDTLSLRSRNDTELAGRFPELAELLRLAPGTVLDGEIVVMNGGKPDMQALLPRLQAGMPGTGTVPVTYIVFDILERDGKDLTGLPLTERREQLEAAVREGPHVVLSVPIREQGEDYYRAAVAQGLEGIMAKRKDSRYEPGLRSGSWLKIKAQQSCDCVIAGYTPGQGGRGPAFGALLLGLYELGHLVPAGKVGTGFSDRLLADLMERFAPLVTAVPQLAGIRGTVIWLEPVLVCEVAYQEVTRDRKLRIPRFLRLRTDKPAAACTTDQLAEVHPRPAAQAGARPAGGGHGARVKPELRNYHEKRNFMVTTEPAGAPDMSGNSFVIQEHHSHKLHYDLRLERDGVLKSWAVPKGVPEAAGEKHLAVAVEDHPLEYGTFEGEIPKGEYGAGTVTIWDSGTYETKHWDPEKIEVTLHGRRLHGQYVLVKFKRAGKNEWLVFRAGA
ncbi:non-homologous end-joining DNA ligase [Methanoregula sp.]|uniref:non-homologous end-joining DNA ligase n=1 Tax=Methanoregula sp. TaxID=2052170 RepID=UPI003C71D05D